MHSSHVATTARRLSQRSTEALLRQVLKELAAPGAPSRAVLETHREPMLIFRDDRRIVAVNSAAQELFGHAEEALVGQLTDMLIPARLRQPDAPPMVRTTDVTTVELPGLFGDGSESSLSWTFMSLDGAEPLFVAIVRDRAEIDEALEALHDSEERFRLLVEGVRDHAIFLLDASGRVASWNAGAEKILGWRAEEVLGQPYEVFFGDDERRAGEPAANLEEAARAGRHELTAWRRRKDGSRFFAESSLSALRHADGSLRGFTKITHDITVRQEALEAKERWVAERAAREAAEAAGERVRRLHRVAEALSKASTSNEVAEVMLGEGLAQLTSAAGAIYVLDAESATLRLLDERGNPAGTFTGFASVPLAMDTPIGDAVRTGEPLFFTDAAACVRQYPALESAIRGSAIEAATTLPLIGRDGPIGTLGFFYREPRRFDASERSIFLTMSELCAQALERARLYEAANRARAEAEAANRAKDEFLAMLGHELRNPLAPISTAVQLMRLRADERTARERAVIERQLAHLTRLVDDLLDVSRVTRGRLELARSQVDLADVVARAVEMASPLLEQRGHRLQMSGERGLEVHGDPARLAQVVSNLVTNAAKYTPPGGAIEVDVRAEGESAVIRVRDNGEGISPALLPVVFDLFVQGRQSLDRAQGGLGIGLALVKNLVLLHGGSVTAASEGPGKGSEFTVRLPLLADGAAGAAAAPGEPTRVPAGGRRVLVVDDNRDSAEMLAHALEHRGYEVAFALDPLSALERLGSFAAEVAVLDLGLPVMDGFELARRIREQCGARLPRLIALSGYGQKHDRARSQDAGFAAHLVKPADLEAIVAEIEREPRVAEPPAASRKSG